MLVAQSYLTLCDPRDCSPPGFSVLGILQARILEWVAISFSRDLPSRLRDQTWVFCITGRFFTVWAARKLPTGSFLPRRAFLWPGTQECSLSSQGYMWGKHWPLPSWAAQSPCSSSNTEVGQPTLRMWMRPWSKSEFSISKLCNLWHPFFLGPWNQGSKRKLATSAREGRASAAGALGYCAHKDCASGVDILRSEGDQKIQRERRWLCTLPAWARGLWAGM